MNAAHFRLTLPAWPGSIITRLDVLIIGAALLAGSFLGLVWGVAMVRGAVERGAVALIEHDRALREGGR